jgi:hypothetical protein
MSTDDVLREAAGLVGAESCFDGSCVFGRRGGMQTNGGCHCLEDRQNHRRLARVARLLAEEVANWRRRDATK